MDHPFSHALTLAWKSGSLSRGGAQKLEHLQERLGMSDLERAKIEEVWLDEEIEFIDRDDSADSVELLEHFSDTLDELRKEKTLRAVRSLGRRFSRHGISRNRLGIALRWLKPFGLDIAFEEGTWSSDDIPVMPLPEALHPLAVKLELAIDSKDIKEEGVAKKERLRLILEKDDTSIDNAIVMRMSGGWDVLSNEKSFPWLPELNVHLDGEDFVWTHEEGEEIHHATPDGDLTISRDLFEAHVASVIRAADSEADPDGDVFRWQLGPRSIAFDLSTLDIDLDDGYLIVNIRAGGKSITVEMILDESASWPPKQLSDSAIGDLDLFMGELISLTIVSLPHQITHHLGIEAQSRLAVAHPGVIQYSLSRSEGRKV
ncbi:MAG TPA: hypothetical protein QF646_07120, partial [Candidatus Poseidoniales archaeon]|nr:hypothetical protein [Candidatus Poseidoniales archaeon]